jgi:hypothetical protein
VHTYYRGPDAFVTDGHLVWLGPTTRIFAVRDLRQVELVEGQITITSPRPVIVATGVLIALAGAGWALAGQPAGYALMVTAVAVAAFAFATHGHRVARVWTLRASYRGVPATLYTSTDVRVFNQVARALRRALEQRPKAGSDQGLQAA